MAETKQTGEGIGAVTPQPHEEASAGRTLLERSVIETIAGIAAREVAGVYRLGKGTLSRAVATVAGHVTTSHGVHADVGRRQTAIDLEMVVEYGYSLDDVASEVRALVARRVERMTGLEVKEVNITIVDIHYEEEAAPRARVE